MSEIKVPGSADAKTWAAHADAGATTCSVGFPPKWTAFLERGPAEEFAAESRSGLFRWEGRHGYEIEITGYEMEAEFG